MIHRRLQNNLTLTIGVSMLAAAVLLLSGMRPGLVDDTLITFQYVSNFLQTGVLTWHPDLPRVDGYTSLGHVLALSLGVWLGGEIVAVNSALCLAAVALIFCVYLGNTRELGAWPRLLGLALIASNASILFWLSAGLDGVPYAAWFFLSYAVFERAERSGRFGPGTAAVLVLLMVWRPEGMVIAPALVAFFWAGRMAGRPAAARSAWIWSALVLAALAALVSWRLQVYGHPLPNTYYAKMSASQLHEVLAGLHYLGAWILGGTGLMLLLSPLGLLMGSGAWLRALFVLGQCAVVVVQGGDPHPGFRFLMPLVPLLALDAAWLADRALPRRIWPVAAGAVAIYVVLQIQPLTGLAEFPRSLRASAERIEAGSWPFRDAFHDPVIRRRGLAARDLDAALKPGVPVVGTDVGALAYHLERPVIDARGLNDAMIATLAKPEGRVNKWGMPRLDVPASDGAPVIYLWFPEPDPWSWQMVATGALGCPRTAFHRAAMWENAMPPGPASAYHCASVPIRGGAAWLNFYLRRGRQDVLSTVGDVEISNCHEQIAQICSLR